MNRNFTITVCGASRVGKSTLINALIGKQLANTSSSLNSCTTSITEYVLERNIDINDQRSNYTIKFWDTPGIETWTESNVRSYLITLMQNTNPVCIIYCVSPATFADMSQVKWFVEQCMHRNIFVALVCTNMFTGNRCPLVMQQFVDLLTSINPSFERYKDGNIEYFGQKALCTKVNSKPYIDEDWGITKEPTGIEELIFGIARCLNGEQQLFWLQAVSQNQRFWTSMGQYVNNIVRIPYATLADISNRTSAVARYFLSLLPTVVTEVCFLHHVLFIIKIHFQIERTTIVIEFQ
jgi:small GTP-binding protein